MMKTRERGREKSSAGAALDLADAAALYRRYASELFGFLIGLTRDRSRAEDALQETFIKVLRAEESGAAVDEPRAWLYAIARRVAIDLYRREARHVGEPLDELLDSSAALAAIVPQSWQGLETAERRRVVQDALAELDVEPRALLLLYAHGLSFRRIGEAIGCSHPTAKKRFTEAAAALTRVLMRGRIFSGGEL